MIVKIMLNMKIGAPYARVQNEQRRIYALDQIKGGQWPVRLKAEEWASGDINWLIGEIAADQKTTVSVLGNFKQVVKDGDLRLHPVIARLVDKETLEKMGAKQQVKKSS